MAQQIDPIEVKASLDISQIEKGLASAIALIQGLGNQTAAQAQQSADRIRAAFDRVGQAAGTIPAAAAKAASELQRLGQSGQASTVVADRLKQIGAVDFSRTTNQVDQLQRGLKTAGEQAAASVAMVSDEIADIKPEPVQAVARAFDNVEKAATTASANGLKVFGEAIQRIRTGLVIVSGAATLALQQSVSAFADFQSSLADVRKTTDLSAEEIDRLAESFRRLSTTTLPNSATELGKIATIAGQLGINGTDAIEKFTVAIAKADAVFSDLDPQGAAEGFAQLNNVLQIEARTGEDAGDAALRLINITNALENSSIATAGAILDVSVRMGATARNAGLAEEEILGLAASVRDVGLSAEVGGTAFTNFFQAFQTESSKMGAALGLNGQQFEELVRKSPYEAFIQLLGAIRANKGGGEELGQVLTDLGLDGARAGALFTSLAGKIEVVERNVATAREEFIANNSAVREFTVRTETLQNKIDLMRNSFVNLAIELGTSLEPVITFLTGTFRTLATTLAAMPEPAKATVAALLIMTALFPPLLILVGQLALSYVAVGAAIAKAKGQLIEFGIIQKGVTVDAQAGVASKFVSEWGMVDTAVKGAGATTDTVAGRMLGHFTKLTAAIGGLSGSIRLLGTRIAALFTASSLAIVVAYTAVIGGLYLGVQALQAEFKIWGDFLRNLIPQAIARVGVLIEELANRFTIVRVAVDAAQTSFRVLSGIIGDVVNGLSRLSTNVTETAGLIGRAFSNMTSSAERVRLAFEAVGKAFLTMVQLAQNPIRIRFIVQDFTDILRSVRAAIAKVPEEASSTGGGNRRTGTSADTVTQGGVSGQNPPPRPPPGGGGTANRVDELERRVRKATEAADKMGDSIRDLNGILDDSRRATSLGVGLVADIGDIENDIEQRRRKIEELRIEAQRSAVVARAGGNAAVIRQVEAQTAELNTALAALDDQLGAELEARIKREADDRVTAIRDRTDQIIAAEQAESERLAVEQGRLLGNEFEARRIAAEASGNREIEQLRAEFGKFREPIDQEIAGLEAELAGLDQKARAANAGGVGIGPEGPVQPDQQLAQLQALEDESTRVRDILTRLQAERQAAVDANAALVTAKERTLQDELARIRAEGLQREIEQERTARRQKLDAQVQDEIRAKEAQIVAVGGDEVAVTRIQAEITAIQESAARERAAIDQRALTMVESQQTKVRDGERRLADFRIELSREIDAREAETEAAKLARVRATLAANSAIREKAAREDEARLEIIETNAEARRAERERDREGAARDVGRLGGTFLVGAGLREQERADAVKDTEEQLGIARERLGNFLVKVTADVRDARAAFIAINGDSAASLARFAEIETGIWAQNEAKKTELTAAESAARVAFARAESDQKSQILIEAQNLVAELFEFSLLRVEDGLIKTGNVLANFSNSVRDNLNNFLVNQVNTIVNVVIQQFIATIASAFTGMLLTGTFTFAGLSTAFQGFVVNVLVGMGLVDKAVMKTGLSFNAMLGWIGLVVIAITGLIALYKELFDTQEEVQQPKNVVTQTGSGSGGSAITTDAISSPRSIAEFQRQASATVFNFNQQFTFDQDFSVSGLDELRKVTADAILGNEPLIRRMVRNIFQQELQLQNVTTGSR